MTKNEVIVGLISVLDFPKVYLGQTCEPGYWHTVEIKELAYIEEVYSYIESHQLSLRGLVPGDQLVFRGHRYRIERRGFTLIE